MKCICNIDLQPINNQTMTGQNSDKLTRSICLNTKYGKTLPPGKENDECWQATPPQNIICSVFFPPLQVLLVKQKNRISLTSSKIESE